MPVAVLRSDVPPTRVTTLHTSCLAPLVGTRTSAVRGHRTLGSPIVRTPHHRHYVQCYRRDAEDAIGKCAVSQHREVTRPGAEIKNELALCEFSGAAPALRGSQQLAAFRLKRPANSSEVQFHFGVCPRLRPHASARLSVRAPASASATTRQGKPWRCVRCAPGMAARRAGWHRWTSFVCDRPTLRSPPCRTVEHHS